MGKRRLTTLSAAVLAGCAFGLVAWATPGAGISTTIISGPVLLDEVDVGTETDGHEVEIKTKGVSDVYVVRNVIQPGGHTGWHSHLGPSIISVVSGVATNYEGDDPQGTVHPAGTAFVDDGNHSHIVRNEGTVPLELIAFQILPAGATRRIDDPQP